jgi:hypothetical protein
MFDFCTEHQVRYKKRCFVIHPSFLFLWNTNCASMARTKQIARKSTGGKSARGFGPRKMLTTEPTAAAEMPGKALKSTTTNRPHRFRPGKQPLNFYLKFTMEIYSSSNSKSE